MPAIAVIDDSKKWTLPSGELSIHSCNRPIDLIACALQAAATDENRNLE